jgi:uncharacterized membrane protein
MPGPDPKEILPSSFEKYPLTRGEYIAALVHLYRGEMHRALTWRTRLDTTTNWAVLITGTNLSFMFSAESHTHVIGILGMVLVYFMLGFEARRFRFFDVWRARVRKIEENFYVPILRRDLDSPIQNWGFVVAEDLLTPRFKISALMAVKARLKTNYLPIFTVLLAAWASKLLMHPSPAFDWETVYGRMHVGLVPSWFVLGAVAGLHAWLLGILLLVRPPRTPEEEYWSPRSDESVDEIS